MNKGRIVSELAFSCAHEKSLLKDRNSDHETFLFLTGIVLKRFCSEIQN